MFRLVRLSLVSQPRLTLLILTMLSSSALGQTLSGAVPAPFTPIEVLEADAHITIQMSGKEYEFSRGPLPTRLRVGRNQLFSEPPSFVSGISGGAVMSISWSKVAVVSASPRKVVVVSTSRIGDIAVRALSTIEYDGMIRVHLKLSADAVRTLDRFEYVLHLPKDAAEFFTHHIPYDYEKLNVDKAKILTSAGLVTGPIAIDFVPSFSLGNRDAGIEWWSETNANWTSSNRPSRSPIEVSKKGDQVDFSVSPISSRVRITPRSPWVHEFAIFSLPQRPAREGWRKNRFISGSRRSKYVPRRDESYYWIAFPTQFEARFDGLPGARGNDKQFKLRDRLERSGVRYIPYGKLTAAPNYHPKTLANKNEWSANRKMFSGPPPHEKKKLLAETDWKEGRVYSYAACMGDQAYADWLIDENLAALKSEKLDGLYFDHGALARECARDPRSVVDGVEVWNYFEVRRFYKTLYERVKAQDPEALITMHSHGQPRALGGWVDYMFVGEALNTVFRGNRSWARVKSSPELYWPAYLDLPEGMMTALTYPRPGGIVSVLPEIKYAKAGQVRPGYPSFQREFLAYALVEGVHFWFANSVNEELESVISALDSVGPLEDDSFVPWWTRSDNHVDADVKVSRYRVASRVLVVASNWGDFEQSARIDLDEILGHPVSEKETVLYRNPETNLPLREWDAAKELALRVPPHDFRLILIQLGNASQ